MPFRRILLVAVAASSLTAQSPEPADHANQLRRDAKLARPVFQRADWSFDYAAARAAAQRHDRLILAYFTRSFAP
jgi:hypothetical protein